jgi:predicted enzyme related to lactoylglutathione lyase
MGERSEHAAGTHSWVDLATTDPQDAKRFYGELFGWSFDDLPVGENAVYTMCRIGDATVAALNEQQPDERSMGVPPHWNNYVTVDDVDAGAAKAGELGATVVAPPFDVMTAGRMAVIQDPTGAFLSLWTAGDSIGATRVNEPGCLTWNDLVSTDPAAARDFYGGLFGWRYEAMGEGTESEYWVCFNGERTNGGLMKTPQEGMPSFWYPYFAVEDADAAKQRIESLGGQPMMGPHDVPQGRFVVASDPQGAAFAVFAGDFDD